MENGHSLTWIHVHQDCREALFHYLLFGLNPGGFLTAVLTNDLYRASTVCDFENARRLSFVARVVLHALPPESFGNDQIMNAWQARTDQERERILTDLGLLPTLFDIIRDFG
jgi:hypothetical protein